jgi:hypothetical protein
MDHIYYKKRLFKYQLTRPYQIQTDIKGYSISELYFHMDEAGLLTIHALYAWDGPSGPTMDGPDNLRASLVHDVIYQMMRMKLIPESHKDYADRTFRTLLLEDGMDVWRADIWYEGVHLFASYACEPGSEEKEKIAP